MAKLRHLFLITLLLFAGLAQARLEVTVTGGTEGALPIAIVPFASTGQAPPEDIAAIIRADLARSGRFAPLAEAELVARPHEAKAVDFAAWRGARVDTLLVGQVEKLEGDFYQVRFQLLDVLRGSQLAGYVIRAGRPLLRRTAHQISDLVYEKLTGERGAFNTHVAYVTVHQDTDGKRRFRLAVADSDGHNEQIILSSEQPLMSPAWSPDGKRLAYVSFEEKRPVVFVQNVVTGQRQRIASYSGINSAPAWSPDGRRLALTLSKDGNPEIYLLEVEGGALTRITNHWAIDTEPAWMPDGRSLVFTSDRGGRPQVYRIDVNGGARTGTPRRLTYEGSYNARASVSPDGKHIAMVHQTNKGYQIAVQELATGNLRVLTDSRLDESPSFAPNGRMILYGTEVGGTGVLEAVSVDGRAHQRLGMTGADVREPAWSPFFSEQRN